MDVPDYKFPFDFNRHNNLLGNFYSRMNAMTNIDMLGGVQEIEFLKLYFIFRLSVLVMEV
jgi:hypothetical protein